jgi:acetoin utilization protein AcuB
MEISCFLRSCYFFSERVKTARSFYLSPKKEELRLAQNLLSQRIREVNLMKQMPKIEKVMTAMPHSVERDLSVSKAMELMRQYHIRHLPVQHGGKLCGILSDRDVKLALSLSGADQMTVEDVMTPDPYIVRPHTSLQDVLSEMTEHKYGCTLICQDNGKLVGIFTAIDGLRYLNEVLSQNYRAAIA